MLIDKSLMSTAMPLLSYTRLLEGGLAGKQSLSFKIKLHIKPMCLQGRVHYLNEYKHSSARFYATAEQGIYTITNFIELHDIDLTK